MATNRVAVVTGGNKGIGYGVVRALCKNHPEWTVFLTARDVQRGEEAVKSLNGEGLKPLFHQLDIESHASIVKLHDDLKAKFGGLDVLVNNAGIAFKGNATEPVHVQAETTVKLNYFGTLDVCQTLFPLLRPHARVVNVSSMVIFSTLKKCSADLKAKFVNPTNLADLSQSMNNFIKATKNGDYAEKGWGANVSTYGVSKVGVTVMSALQQRAFDADSRADIIVNACCPGFVDTDMTSHKGVKTIDQGADTPVYLAELPLGDPSNPKGQHVSDRKVQNWAA